MTNFTLNEKVDSIIISKINDLLRIIGHSNQMIIDQD